MIYSFPCSSSPPVDGSQVKDLQDDQPFWCLQPSENHQRLKSEEMSPLDTEDDSEQMTESTSKWSEISQFFGGSDMFNRLTIEMAQQYLREEELRARHQTALLRLREKALKEKTKAELSLLEHQKMSLKNKVDDDKMTAVLEKEHQILTKLQQEQAEIKHLQNIYRAAHQERKLLLKQQKEILKIQHSTAYLQQKLQQSQVSDAKDLSPRTKEVGKSVFSPGPESSARPTDFASVSGNETSSTKEKMKKMQNPLDEKFLANEEKMQMKCRTQEELIQWKQRLDAEEDEVLRIEAEARTVLCEQNKDKTLTENKALQNTELTDRSYVSSDSLEQTKSLLKEEVLVEVKTANAQSVDKKKSKPTMDCNVLSSNIHAKLMSDPDVNAAVDPEGTTPSTEQEKTYSFSSKRSTLSYKEGAKDSTSVYSPTHCEHPLKEDEKMFKEENKLKEDNKADSVDVGLSTVSDNSNSEESDFTNSVSDYHSSAKSNMLSQQSGKSTESFSSLSEFQKATAVFINITENSISSSEFEEQLSQDTDNSQSEGFYSSKAQSHNADVPVVSKHTELSSKANQEIPSTATKTDSPLLAKSENASNKLYSQYVLEDTSQNDQKLEESTPLEGKHGGVHIAKHSHRKTMLKEIPVLCSSIKNDKLEEFKHVTKSCVESQISALSSSHDFRNDGKKHTKQNDASSLKSEFEEMPCRSDEICANAKKNILESQRTDSLEKSSPRPKDNIECKISTNVGFGSRKKIPHTGDRVLPPDNSMPITNTDEKIAYNAIPTKVNASNCMGKKQNSPPLSQSFSSSPQKPLKVKKSHIVLTKEVPLLITEDTLSETCFSIDEILSYKLADLTPPEEKDTSPESEEFPPPPPPDLLFMKSESNSFNSEELPPPPEDQFTSEDEILQSPFEDDQSIKSDEFSLSEDMKPFITLSKAGEDHADPLWSFNIGDRVLVRHSKPGVLKFKGYTGFQEGYWAGVALDKPEGDHDGTFQGIKYFECNMNCGVFATPDQISHLLEDYKMDKDFSESEDPFTDGSSPRNYKNLENSPKKGGGFGKKSEEREENNKTSRHQGHKCSSQKSNKVFLSQVFSNYNNAFHRKHKQIGEEDVKKLMITNGKPFKCKDDSGSLFEDIFSLLKLDYVTFKEQIKIMKADSSNQAIDTAAEKIVAKFIDDALKEYRKIKRTQNGNADVRQISAEASQDVVSLRKILDAGIFGSMENSEERMSPHQCGEMKFINQQFRHSVPQRKNEVFCIPHNIPFVQELTRAAVDELWRHRNRSPNSRKIAMSKVFHDHNVNENKLDADSTRMYKQLIFDLTYDVLQEIFKDAHDSNTFPWVKGLLIPSYYSDRISKEEDINEIKIQELHEEESHWVEYSEDEFLVKMKVTEDIFNTLIQDTIEILNTIYPRRFQEGLSLGSH
ncbi:centrosome-associated protein 350 [Latimeria chalumnae]|uniref:centrosome-associated protein 350 n=1 Tax=Latimeria chalumnae TaxID=7897 RepID=UPI00313C4D73